MLKLRFPVWQPGYFLGSNGAEGYVLAPFSRCANCGEVTPHADEVIAQRGKQKERASLPPHACPHCHNVDMYVDVPEATNEHT